MQVITSVDTRHDGTAGLARGGNGKRNSLGEGKEKLRQAQGTGEQKMKDDDAIELRLHPVLTFKIFSKTVDRILGEKYIEGELFI
jgi:hypothetical protein